MKCKFVAGLDVGASIGFSKVFVNGDVVVDTIKPKSDYMARLDALQRIADICRDADCVGVVVENPMGRHYNVLRMHMQMLGAFMMACHERHVPCVAVNLTEIKKNATGKGNADKAMMIASAKARFGIDMDEHQADAAMCGAYGIDHNLF